MLPQICVCGLVLCQCCYCFCCRVCCGSCVAYAPTIINRFTSLDGRRLLRFGLVWLAASLVAGTGTGTGWPTFPHFLDPRDLGSGSVAVSGFWFPCFQVSLFGFAWTKPEINQHWEETGTGTGTSSLNRNRKRKRIRRPTKIKQWKDTC